MASSEARISALPGAWLVAVDRARPTVSNVRFADLEGDGRLEHRVRHGTAGLVMLGRPADPAMPLTVIGDVPAPAHAEVW